MSDRALSVLVHGMSKVGKSTLSVTAPYPRLLLDVESASRFLPVVKTYWNPLDGSPPPVADGTWDTCIVNVDKFEVVKKAYEWLASGRHQFRSVILDSISELQKKAQEDISNRKQMRNQDWGTLLAEMGYFCRDLRDLTTHRTNPIEAIVITSMSFEKDGMLKPYLQGQIVAQIPYLYDITGYYYEDQEVDPTTGHVQRVRRLLTAKHPQFEAGNRVPGLPEVITQPNIESMIESVFGPRPTA